MLAGLLHDLGKYDPDFQLRLDGSLISVEHSIAGAALALMLAKAPRDKVMAELIAHAIAGHHAGLPDRIGCASSLNERLQRANLDRLAPVWQTEISPVASDLLPAFAPRCLRTALFGSPF